MKNLLIYSSVFDEFSILGSSGVFSASIFLISSFAPNGLCPKIASKSFLKITSFSSKSSAKVISLSLFSDNILMALWYCSSIITEISLSIVWAVCSLKVL